MKYETINDQSIINKVYRPGRIQEQVLDFHNSDDRIRKLIFEEGEYTGIKSTQTSFIHTIRNLNLKGSICARVLAGELYLIKL
jgi:predicted ribosome quality control (RQC) complex YloA/Tae2 family protein